MIQTDLQSVRDIKTRGNKCHVILASQPSEKQSKEIRKTCTHSNQASSHFALNSPFVFS